MVFKLFKSKDQFGVYNLVKEANELQNFIRKKQSKNNEITITDVQHIISSVKELYKRAQKIEISLNNAEGINQKDKEFMIKVVIDNFNKLKTLYHLCLKYEKELLEYKKTDVKKIPKVEEKEGLSLDYETLKKNEEIKKDEK